MLASGDLKHLCLPGPHFADNCVIDNDIVKVPEAGERRAALVDLDIRIAAHASRVAASMSRLGQRSATCDPLHVRCIGRKRSQILRSTSDRVRVGDTGKPNQIRNHVPERQNVDFGPYDMCAVSIVK